MRSRLSRSRMRRESESENNQNGEGMSLKKSHIAADMKTVLLVCSKKTFIVDAMVDKLEESGYTVSCVKADIMEVEPVEGPAGYVIYYITDDLSEKIQEFLFYLRDIVVEGDKFLYLAGEKADIEIAERMMKSTNVVTGYFERPINVNKVITTFERNTTGRKHKKNILVVDDDGTFLRSVHDWLSDRYQVTMANSGMSAVAYLAKHEPDLILLDYEMPIADGAKVLEMIRTETQTSNTPVIFLTGKDDKESVMKVIPLKPQGYLLKTLSPEKIHQEVDDFFERQKGI